MPLIQPVQMPETDRKTFRLKKELIGKITAYASMIQSPEEYVIDGALEQFFSRDKDFQKYLQEHPCSGSSDGEEKKRRGRPSKLATA